MNKKESFLFNLKVSNMFYSKPIEIEYNGKNIKGKCVQLQFDDKINKIVIKNEKEILN